MKTGGERACPHCGRLYLRSQGSWAKVMVGAYLGLSVPLGGERVVCILGADVHSPEWLGLGTHGVRERHIWGFSDL